MSVLDHITIAGYRSIHRLEFKLKRLNVVCGANGSGKSNLYKALRLLAHTAQGGLPKAIAQEGGMSSILWAGPKKKGPIRLTMAVHSDQFNYEVSLGLPSPTEPSSPFELDPMVKEEFVWTGQPRRRGSTYFERSSSGAWIMDRDGTRVSYSGNLSNSEPVLAQLREPHLYPELSILSRELQEWRFYDHFRTDPGSPLRSPQASVSTPILAPDGIDLAAALQTIRIRDEDESLLLEESIEAVFPGSTLYVCNEGCSFWLEMKVPGIQRSLHVSEFSDGTLRYLCLLAALLSSVPAPLLILNEPENSLHPDVLVPLARLIRRASNRSQVWVTTHSERLAALLAEESQAKVMTLHKVDGETKIVGQDLVWNDEL